MSAAAPTLLDPVPEDAQEAARGLQIMGDPMPWPRAGATVMPRSGGEPIEDYVYKPWIKFHTPAEAAKRAELVAITWTASGQPFFADPEPLVLRAEFIFARPAKHYGTGRNSGTIKPQFLHARPGKGGGKTADGHRTGGDTDNLVKLLLDGLSRAAFDDDGQVVRIEAEKAYTDQAGVTEPQTIFDLHPATTANSAFASNEV